MMDGFGFVRDMTAFGLLSVVMVWMMFKLEKALDQMNEHIQEHTIAIRELVNSVNNNKRVK